MKTQANRFPYLPLLITGIAVILFSTAGVARMMGWGPNSTDDPDDILTLDQAAPVTASEARAKPRCSECGVIVSARSHEITVRMADGSSHVIDDANPARWRTGERVIVIAGTNPSHQ